MSIAASEPAPRPDLASTPPRIGGKKPSTRRLRLCAAAFDRLAFAVIVLLPTLLATFYYGVVASDRYVAEARLIVRRADRSGDVASLAAAEAATKGAGGVEAYVVYNYLQSRNLTRALDRDGNLRRIFARPEVQALERIDPDETEDALWRHTRGMIAARIDTLSDVIRIETQAYRPEDALWLCQEVAGASKALIASYGSKVIDDALAASRGDLDRAAQRYRTALAELQRFQDRTGQIDPIEITKAWGILLTAIEIERVKVAVETSVRESVAAMGGTAYGLMQTRKSVLADRSAETQRMLMSPEDEAKALPAVFSTFEELMLEKTFAERLYVFDRNAHYDLRRRLERDRAVVSVFLPPTVSQHPAYPRRFVNIVLVFVAAFIFWAIFRLATAVVRDSRY